jgi:hypothetical protein
LSLDTAATVLAHLGLDLGEDSTRERLDSPFRYLLCVVTVCQYFRGDYDGDPFEEDDEDEDGDVAENELEGLPQLGESTATVCLCMGA